jgi:hypothetical protein
MKKVSLLLFLYLLPALPAIAQTTVVGFDSPAAPCSTNGFTATYQGIDFTAAAWDCENPKLPGQTGLSISWDDSPTRTSGSFKLVTPAIFASLSAATSSGSGTLTVTSDAGETYSHAITGTFQTLQTGFMKPASVITIKYPGGWTLELDNLTYTIPSVTPPSAQVITALLFPPGGSLITNGNVVTFTTTAAPFTLAISCVPVNCSVSAPSVTVSGPPTTVSHSATLTWSAPASTVVGYNLYRSATSGGPYTKLNSAAIAALTYNDANVSAGQTLYYVATSIDSNASESAYSNEAKAQIPTP